MPVFITFPKPGDNKTTHPRFRLLFSCVLLPKLLNHNPVGFVLSGIIQLACRAECPFHPLKNLLGGVLGKAASVLPP